ncbi:hypothetical protein NDU88_001379 [Pleurodeles waltl]|uniref:Uncharacterized protein n=1 Tax=Pleurodeles waltl TaxID=8319 RepID=A0AAV7WKB7_PLEWA|nr:hypothetical protein NDU88_001379 [Pleurodeles waltl]
MTQPLVPGIGRWRLNSKSTVWASKARLVTAGSEGRALGLLRGRVDRVSPRPGEVTDASGAAVDLSVRHPGPTVKGR